MNEGELVSMLKCEDNVVTGIALSFAKRGGTILPFLGVRSLVPDPIF